MDDRDQTEITREHLETSKQRAIVYREWAYFAIAVLVAGMFVWAAWAFKGAQNVSGIASAKLIDITKAIEDKINAIPVEGVKPLMESLTAELLELKTQTAGIGETREQLTGLLSDARGELKPLLASLRGVTEEVMGVATETRTQIKQNGDEVTKTVASLNRTITDLDTKVSKIFDDGTLMLETSNPKIQAILDNANAAIIDTDGRIKAFEPIQTNLAGITSDFNAMTTDSKKKLQEIFWPPAKHGWARVGQVATYFLTPMFEGSRLYFSIKALPVRVTQPIPIGRP
jgi:hypothetical protein